MKGNLTTGTTTVGERMTAAVERLNQTPTATPVAAPTVAPVNPPAPSDSQASDSSFFKKGQESNPLESKTSSVKLPTEAPKVESKPADTVTTKRKIQAGKKEIEVDLSDEQSVLDAFKKAEGFRKAFAERDQYKKSFDQIKREAEELKKYKQAFEKIEELKNNPEELYKRMTGGKSLEEEIQQRIERAKALENATPEQIENARLMERLAQLERKAQSEEEARIATEKKVSEKQQQTDKVATQTQIFSEFNKVRFGDKVKDAALAEELDDMLKNKAIAGIDRYLVAFEKQYGREPEKIPQSIIKREFEKAAKLLAPLAGTTPPVVEVGSKEAAKEAEEVSTKNYGSQLTEEDIRKYASRPTQLFKQFFRK